MENWEKSPLLEDKLFEKNEPRATFVGYPSDSPIAGKKRLYLDIEFNTYIDIEENDILLMKPVSREVLEFGGVRIWISKYAEVLYGGTFSQKLSAKSLQEELGTNIKNMLIPGHLGIYNPGEVQVHNRMK
jgi:hypothetical protein